MKDKSALRQPLGAVATSLGMSLGVAILDFITGEQITVTLIYLVPICWSAWFASRNAGVFIAVTSAVTWLGASLLGGTSARFPWLLAWDTIMLGGIYVVVAVLLAALKRSKVNLEAKVVQRTATLREDVAVRRQAEDQLRQTYSELQRTQVQLIEAAKMEMVGRMAAAVQHEVKNLLLTMSLGVDYFQHHHTTTADEATLLEDMKKAVRRGSAIINLMLDFAKPSRLILAPEDLNALIDHSLGLVRQQLIKQRIDVLRLLQTPLPAVQLDRVRLEHVLVNLFTNAAQAMPEGGTLTVRTALQADSATSPEAASEVILEVEDTGPGIPSEHLDKVFDPFFATKSQGQGTGLGLSIVRRILQMQGGTIIIGNRPEGGGRTTLTFNLKPKPQP